MKEGSSIIPCIVDPRRSCAESCRLYGYAKEITENEANFAELSLAGRVRQLRAEYSLKENEAKLVRRIMGFTNSGMIEDCQQYEDNCRVV